MEAPAEVTRPLSRLRSGFVQPITQTKPPLSLLKPGYSTSRQFLDVCQPKCNHSTLGLVLRGVSGSTHKNECIYTLLHYLAKQHLCALQGRVQGVRTKTSPYSLPHVTIKHHQLQVGGEGGGAQRLDAQDRVRAFSTFSKQHPLQLRGFPSGSTNKNRCASSPPPPRHQTTSAASAAQGSISASRRTNTSAYLLRHLATQQDLLQSSRKRVRRVRTRTSPPLLPYIRKQHLRSSSC